MLGLWIMQAIGRDAASTIGTVYATIARLDGVKMLLLAALTAVTITLSGFGYLFLINTLALAAWAWLPCLIVFITGVGVTLNQHRNTSHKHEE